MSRILFYSALFLCVAISLTIAAHLSALSAPIQSAVIISLLVMVLLMFGLLVMEDITVKWLAIRIEQLRFSLTAITIAVMIGLAVSRLRFLFGAG